MSRIGISLLLLASTFYLTSCSDDDAREPAPSLTSFSPTEGIAGTTVTLTGKNFSTLISKNTVLFNGTAAVITATTPTTITTTVPAGASTGKLTVTVGTQTITSTQDFIVPLIPTISSFSPLQGIAGTSVTITGTNFSTTATNNIVKFNNTTATVTAATTTSLTVTVPAGAATGTISVQVGSQTAVSVESFTVPLSPTISSFSPLQGIVGTSITITGTNFSATASENIVKFNNTTATVTAASNTSLTVAVPAGATSGTISVQVGSQSVISSTSFTLIPTLTFTGFEPSSGTPGSIILISVTNFPTIPNLNIVTFNGTAAVVTGVNATSLKVRIPEGATTGKIKIEANSQVLTSATDFNVFNVQVSTFAGSTKGFLDDSGIAAQLSNPYRITTDAAGNFYVADLGNHRIRKITTSGVVTTLAGGSSGSNDGTGAAASFNGPSGIAVDGSGNVFVSEVFGHRIRKITPAGEVTTFAGSTQGFADGTGTAAQFNRPSAIAIDGEGNLFITDTNNHRIRKITPAGVVTTIAGSTEGIANGTTTEALFNLPEGIAIDAANNLYISESPIGNGDGGRVRKISSSNTVSTVAGGTANFTDGSNFYVPRGLTVDGSGNVYVADTFNNRIYKIYPSGFVIIIVGNNSGSADGNSISAQFNQPTDITIGADGNLYIIDSGNSRIRKLVMN